MTVPLAVSVAGVGLLGPGFADWSRGSAALRDLATWSPQPTVVPPPQRLPPTERRRAGLVVKAALTVADEAVAAAGADAADLATVFTSATGDPANCHALCEALAAPDRLVSPTRFTNSVHNAPAGYWHIATASRRASTSLAAYDASFAAGLVEAAAQCRADGAPRLFVACDVPYPVPLHSLRPVPDTFALAIVLTAGGPGPTLTLAYTPGEPPTRCDDARLDALRGAIPAARALPLLQALARGVASKVVVDDQPGLALVVEVQS